MKFSAILEDFVQFVWKFQLFDTHDLISGSKEKITIINPGEQNLASGPDFFKSKIQIDETLWVGTVEIHLSVKEWKTHKHQLDPAYNNVVLHVVYEDPAEEIILQNGRRVPTLVIGNRIYQKTLQNYNQLKHSENLFIPCQGLVENTEAFVFFHFYQVLVMERLQRKVSEIEQELELTQGDIDRVFLSALFKHFGSPLNKGPFEILSRSFTLKQLSAQCSNTQQLESFLFGLANMLNNQDAYSKLLANEFTYTKNKFKLQVYCNASSWKFKGTRPANFPSVRLAQLAALLYKNPLPFQSILAATELEELYSLLNIELSGYWQNHYSFGKPSRRNTNNLSKSFKNKLIINVVVPFLFFYGKYVDNELLVNRSLGFLEAIKAEKNAVSKGFTNLGFPLKNAFDSQAQLQLFNTYCKVKRCLECRLGYQLLRKDKSKSLV